MLAVSLFTQAVIVIALWVVSGGVANAQFSIGPVQMMIFEDGRPCGTLFSPVLAGSYLGMLIIPSTALAMVTVSWLRRQLCYVAVFAGIVGLGLTQTRGAILGLIIGGVAFGTPAVSTRDDSPQEGLVVRDSVNVDQCVARNSADQAARDLRR